MMRSSMSDNACATQFLGPSSKGRQAPGLGYNSWSGGTSQRSGKKASGFTQYFSEVCISMCRTHRIASSVGQRLPASSVTLMPGFPARVAPAGGKKRIDSLMTARVYRRLFNTRGFSLMTVAAAAGLGPSTLSCSARSWASASGLSKPS